MNAVEIVWEDPTPTNQGRHGRDWSGFVAELKRHPGKWAIAFVSTTAQGTASACGRRLRLAYGCEATTRGTGPQQWTTYARWPEDAS